MVARAANSSSVKGSGASGFSATRYTSTLRMLCTLPLPALRRGAGQTKITWLPRCAPDSNSVRCGIRSTGGSGGRRLPQVGAIDNMQSPSNNIKWRGADLRDFTEGLRNWATLVLGGCLENVTAEILILDRVFEHALNVGSVDRLLLGLEVGTFETDLVEKSFDDRVQAPRADVFRFLVHASREVCNRIDRVWLELELDSFGFHQCLVLPDERVLGLDQDALEIIDGQRLELDANREASLKFRNQIRRLGNVKGAGGNEKNMVRAHHSVTRVDRGAFDNGQNVALHAFARNVRAATRLASGNLVDFIQKDDARGFNAFKRRARDGVHVDEPLFLFLHQVFHGLIDTHLATLASALKKIAEHVLHVDAHFLDAHGSGQFDGWVVLFAHLEFNQPVVELAGAKLRAQLFSSASRVLALWLRVGNEDRGSRLAGIEVEHRAGAGGFRRQQHIEDSFFDSSG